MFTLSKYSWIITSPNKCCYAFDISFHSKIPCDSRLLYLLPYIKFQEHEHGHIILGDDVWIGGGASILINTEIGEGAIISSNSTASGDFPPFSISMGNPATILKYRD